MKLIHYGFFLNPGADSKLIVCDPEIHVFPTKIPQQTWHPIDEIPQCLGLAARRLSLTRRPRRPRFQFEKFLQDYAGFTYSRFSVLNLCKLAMCVQFRLHRNGKT